MASGGLFLTCVGVNQAGGISRRTTQMPDGPMRRQPAEGASSLLSRTANALTQGRRDGGGKLGSSQRRPIR